MSGHREEPPLRAAFIQVIWTLYRKWKRWLTGALMILAYILLKLEPELSARWKVGVIIVVTLGIAYLVEELVWISKKRGRPCEKCGQNIQVKPFSLRIRCPHCGHME